MSLRLLPLVGLLVIACACSAVGDDPTPDPSPKDPSPTDGAGGSVEGSDTGGTGSDATGGAGPGTGGEGTGAGEGVGGVGTGGDGTGGDPVEPEIPKFAYRKMLVDRHTAIYNPTQEFIFSSVIETTHIESPLGKYYHYYAPHDAPGGISLAYADNIEGPWTEYPDNPLITNTHQGRFDVTHISSPHVVWMEEYDKYFLYFHGENTTTRWSHSTDGINWDIAEDNISVNTAAWAAEFGNTYTECSYARVFKYAIPGIGDPYTMMMMLIQFGHGRRIGLATSSDGKHFTPRDHALITPTGDEGSDIAGPFYFPFGGRHYVLYNAASGNIHYTEVGASFDLENHLGSFYTPGPSYPEYSKASAPFIWSEDERYYLFYDVGTRLEQSIGLAVQATNPSMIIDQSDAEFSMGGGWSLSTATEGFYGEDYLADNSADANPDTWAKWKPDFPQSGAYRVYVRFPAGDNRPDQIKYNVYHQGAVDEVFVDQTQDNGSWVELGSYQFDAGTSEDNRVTLDAASDTGFAVADAVWFAFDE